MLVVTLELLRQRWVAGQRLARTRAWVSQALITPAVLALDTLTTSAAIYRTERIAGSRHLHNVLRQAESLSVTEHALDDDAGWHKGPCFYSGTYTRYIDQFTDGDWWAWTPYNYW